MRVAETEAMSANSKLPSLSDTVAVILTTYNDAKFLREALASVLTQQHLPDEILVVDDGSTVDPAPIVADFPQVVLLHKTHGGVTAARNVGLHKVSSTFVIFLDADDRLMPNAITAGLNCFACSPAAAMVYGGHTRIGSDGVQIGRNIYRPVSSDPYADLLAGNLIGMHATVLYRREVLLALGGFDEDLSRCEDYEMYLRLAQQYLVFSHPETVAEYRWHGENTSRDTSPMLGAALAVLDQHRDQTGARRRAWISGRRFWKIWYARTQKECWDGEEVSRLSTGNIGKLKRAAVRKAKNWLRYGRFHRVIAHMRGRWPPLLGSVRFGTLASTRPVSLDFGWDRGTPVDRYYVENFLSRHSGQIAGRVLEVGDDAYSRRFGAGKISTQDVLNRHPGSSKTTLVGDLTQPGVLPEEVFDCIVLTQTLQLIFDLPQAVERLYAALRPSGVLLLTVPGISQVDRLEWRTDWCWSFTPTAIRKLFAPLFGEASLTIETHGNVFAATAFLQGVVLEELDRVKLDVGDEAYPVVVTLRAEKR